MITEQRTVYRCGFCRRFTKFQARFALAHEVHCKKNPNRTPFIGELTFAQQAGQWIDNPTAPLRGFTAERMWRPYTKQPAWWPGKPGMIYAADGWHDVPGYENRDPGPYGDDRAADHWPEIGTGSKRKPVGEVKPFWHRVEMLGLELDERHQAWLDEEDYRVNYEPPILAGPSYG